MPDRYSNIKTINRNGIPIYKSVKYPTIPLAESDIYVITGEGDRFDLLAYQFYGDSSLWWVISCANESLPQNSLIPPIGAQIRIPVNSGAIVNSFNRLNKL